MTKKSITFSVALSQTAEPKRRGAPSKLEKVRERLEPIGEWELFREALVDKNIPVRAIHEALALSGIKVTLATVQRWRKDIIAKNHLIWAQVDRDMAFAEVEQLRKGN